VLAEVAGVPEGSKRMPEVALETIDEAECVRLISPGGIGRLCFAGRFDLTVLPVNYVLQHDAIVFRTASGGTTEEDLRTTIGVAHAEYRVAFEVDDFDATSRTGWSVLVQGPAHHIDSDPGRADAEAAGLQSWAGDNRDHFIRITPTRITGRRIRRGESPAAPARPGAATARED
jgi:nitroimidazol reductase NimA-like FMN-containing flavoprotein (pyridoxamine 5'-phosphate oxidase superfamily)